MWLIVIQVVALIAASIRGWGAKPVIMYGLLLAFSFVAGAMVGPDAMSFLQILDYIIVGVFIVMAIIGKEKEPKKTESQSITPQIQPRIKCPHCAELIMPDANICPFCRREVSEDFYIKHAIENEELDKDAEYYYKLGLVKMQNKNFYGAKYNFFRAMKVSSPSDKWHSSSQARLLEIKTSRK